MNAALLNLYRRSSDGNSHANKIAANTGPRWFDRTLRRPLVVLSLLLSCVLFPSAIWAQAVDLVTFQNTEVTYVFSSQPNAPSLIGNASPQNGTVEWVNTGSFSYTLTYTPNENFIGSDNFRIRRWETSPAPHFSILDVSIIVAPALIEAHHDYAVAEAGETVVVDVLANDISSNGIKILQAVPAVNHGSAEFNATTGLISFTPKPGFRGLAHFNYALCNGVGDCDDGTVSITVMGDEASTEDETIKVFTKKNETQFILVPAAYSLVAGPANGVFDPGADVPEYTPAADYVGADEIRFTNGTHEVIYDIEVLDLATNVFAIDDRAFTTTNASVDVDVQDNDSSTGSSCFSVYTAPQNGVAEHVGNGVIAYTPNTGFVGVDQFTYRSYVSSCAGEPEVATVTVFVSNFAPDRTTFEMATPKETPIIIGYNVPATTFSFEISSQGELGETVFLQGEVNTVINGLPIQGNNMLIYIPNAGVEEGLDEIEITYCLLDPQSGSNDCMVSKQVKIWMTILDIGDNGEPVCVGDCVWAGDTNADGIVNMTDLLPIGQSMGKIGGERLGATFDLWYGQYADDWSNLFGGTEVVNIKHIDADGNSIVTAADTTAIRSFYGRTHNMVPSVMPYAPFEFIVTGPLFVNPGDYVEFTIDIGTAEIPAEDVYGFVFPFRYNSDYIQPESANITWGNDNFLAYDSPVLYMDHNDGSLFEAGYTRTSGLVASGHGQIAEFGIVIDDIAGFRSDEKELLLQFGGDAGTSLDKYGNFSAVKVQPFELRVRLASEENELTAPLDELLKTFPNPTGNYLTVHLNGQKEFDQVTLSSLTGQVVINQSNIGRTNRTYLDLSNLPGGMYILSVTTPEGTVNRKIEVMH